MEQAKRPLYHNSSIPEQSTLEGSMCRSHSYRHSPTSDKLYMLSETVRKYEESFCKQLVDLYTLSLNEVAVQEMPITGLAGVIWAANWETMAHCELPEGPM
eukprot:4503102-Amphidinium_carterae.1